jgi:hypothetical protein
MAVNTEILVTVGTVTNIIFIDLKGQLMAMFAMFDVDGSNQVDCGLNSTSKEFYPEKTDVIALVVFPP